MRGGYEVIVGPRARERPGAMRLGMRVHPRGPVESTGELSRSLRLMVEDREAQNLKSASGASKASTWGHHWHLQLRERI
jgi:hypothetical protein